MASIIEEKIRELGKKGNIEELQEYIGKINTNELLNLVQDKLSNASFTYIWNCILEGFTSSSNSHKKRFETVMKVVKELEKNEISSQHCNAIISRLCMELVKFKTVHLVPLCNFCLECLESQRVTQMSWKELMPELLNVISQKQLVEDNDVEMTGLEYKQQVINSMCLLRWSPDIVTTLAAMFIDISLTKEEHLKVVNKLGGYLEKLTPQEIPAFVYQLLRLCEQGDGRVIFSKLQQYFGPRVYENQTLLNQNSENSDIGAIENSNDQDTLEAESTVLFHIHSCASLEHECIRDYLLSFKNLLKSPEFVLHPFQLSVLFTISTISGYQEKVFEIVRSCISRYYHEEQKKLSSAWFRDMVPNSCKIESVISQIINLSAEGRDFVLQGLVDFAFLLLGVGASLGKDVIAEKQWQLGNMILFKIIKRKRHTAPSIIQQLTNRIGSGHTQYIECLYMLSTNLTLLMLENKSTVVSLMELLVQMPENNATQLLDAIIPLTKVSPTIRDHFIVLLRKALYSKNTETRQVAVVGFLKLLTNLKISNLAALSQSTFSGSYSSGHSLFTQFSIDRASHSTPSAFSNEALCWEVLIILRKCFMQEADVRVQLYEGLYDAVCLNPELGVPVLDILWGHFSEFYEIDDETLPPLKFENVTLTRDVTVTLQEPLGKLIYTIGLITTTVSKVDNENATVSKIKEVLDSLCSRMTKCELVHFKLDDGTDLLDIMPESQQKLFILKEAMNVYEALIGYKFFSWDKRSENHAKQINSLFMGYSRLLTFSKNLTKPKKADSKKKKDQNKTTQQASVSNATLKKDGQKVKAFKPPDTLLDFQVINKILSLLYEQMVTWTTVTQANIIKSKRDFHQHIMQATLTLLSSIKNKKIIEVQSAKLIYAHLCDIATVLYERIIKKMDEIIDFDCTTAVLAAESFLVILNIINNHHRSNLKSFLSRVDGRDGDEDLVAHLTEFVETYEKLFEIDEEEVSEDPEIKKLPLVVINTLNFFVHQIPSFNNTLALQMMEWLKNFATSKNLPNRHVVTNFVSLLFDCHIKFKVSLSLFEKVSVCLGDVVGVITEEEHDTEEFSIITEHSAKDVFTSLCSSVKAVLEDIDWIIARLRAEYCMITYPGESNLERRREYLKSKEKGVCAQLCFIITILTHLSNCTVPPGNLFEMILKNIMHLYITLRDLAKYFILRSSKVNPIFKAARFDRVVKLAGKQLAPVVYKFIMYIEESRKKELKGTQGNKKKNVDSSTLKNRVLKETRLIPKTVYEIEQFSKFVTQLSNKTKFDLSKLVGQGLCRDYRFMHLKQVLEEAKDGTSTQTSLDTSREDSSLVEDEDNEREEGVDEENSPPPSKKQKTKN